MHAKYVCKLTVYGFLLEKSSNIQAVPSKRIIELNFKIFQIFQRTFLSPSDRYRDISAIFSDKTDLDKSTEICNS